MNPPIFIKLGGSVITDKIGQQAADMPTIRRLARELRAAFNARPDMSIVLGHGSGSFGHTVAARYGIHKGLAPGAGWLGFAETAAAALRLNRILVDALLAAGLPALALQPSATLQSEQGAISRWDTTQVYQALSHGLLPVIHGDVAFDSTRGSAIISTEQLFHYLALQTSLAPARLILVGEPAVYTADPRLDPVAERIPLITGANIDVVLSGAGASHGTDVTGGMHSKIKLIWSLITSLPNLEVQLIGPAEGLLVGTLCGTVANQGTVVRLV